MKDVTVAFYQVQDKVSPSLIKSFTEYCDRENCCVSFRMGETTLAGTSDYYDKEGNLIIENRNIFSGNICCKVCWRGGKIDSEGNYSEINHLDEKYRKWLENDPS